MQEVLRKARRQATAERGQCVSKGRPGLLRQQSARSVRRALRSAALARAPSTPRPRVHTAALPLPSPSAASLPTPSPFNAPASASTAHGLT
jgi:hypothetical protein